MKHIFFSFLLIIFFGCSQQKNSPQTTKQSSDAPQYHDNVSQVASVEKGSDTHVPNFTWYDESGKKISLAEAAKGKPVLINFWATWCGPCVKEIPDLVELNNEVTSKGGMIIGISVDKDADALTLVSGFAKEKNMKYPIIIDNGDLENAFGGLRGIPTTFIVNKDGVIINKLVGLRTKEVFAKELSAVL